MEFEISKNLEDYRSNFFWGMTVKETMYGGLSLLLGGATVYIFHSLVTKNMFLCAITVFPLAMPIAFQGFWTSSNGLSFFKYIRTLIKVKFSKTLYYVAADGYEEILLDTDKKGMTNKIVDKMLSKKGDEE